MSTPKNKLSADFDRRGKRASVVQRFITSEQPAEQNESNPTPTPEQNIEPEKISEISEDTKNINEIQETNETNEPKESNEINETEELKSKIEFLTSQLDKIKDIENKINSIEAAQNKLKNDVNTNSINEQTEKIKQPEIISEPPSKYYLRNVMEEAVVAEVTAALKHMSGICKCEKCFYDICAIVLNSTSPNYATSEQGELLGKANTLLNAGIRNKVSGEVFKAAEKVKKQPMHG